MRQGGSSGYARRLHNENSHSRDSARKQATFDQQDLIISDAFLNRCKWHGVYLVQVNNMKHEMTRNPDYTVPFSAKMSDEVQNNEREKSEQVRLT